jgi:hypothetical protein
LTETSARGIRRAGRASHYPSAYRGTIDTVGAATGKNDGKRASGVRGDDSRGREIRGTLPDRRDTEQAAAVAAGLASGIAVMRRFAARVLVRR